MSARSRMRSGELGAVPSLTAGSLPLATFL